MKIEDIILSRDKRTVSSLRPFLPSDFVQDAGRFVMDLPGTVLIASGFFIKDAGIVETDGPPGAIAIGRALQRLGRRVCYVTDKHGTFCFRSEESPQTKIIEFPICNIKESEKEALILLDEIKPSLIISIERPGMTIGGQYRNSVGGDITPYTARLDYLFSNHPYTVGIGDGGNEIGMGLLYEAILRIPTLAPLPTITPTSHLIASSVSNWGGYGLVAALSKLSGIDLMPTRREQEDLINWELEQGVFGRGSTPETSGVDGFAIEDSLEIIDMLHDTL